MKSSALAGDLRVVGLIGAAHCGSHFYHLVLPPLFPFLIKDFGVGYIELGVLMTVFFGVSGALQTPAGFVVDRYGAARVLTAGLLLLGLGTLAAAFAPSYALLVVAAAVMGVGNSVFHPSDYAILSHHVSPSHMARAYSVHTVGGTIGWAISPLLMVSVAEVASWRVALLCACLVGFVIAGLIWADRERLETPKARLSTGRAGGDGWLGQLRMLTALPILACVGFFFFQSTAFMATQQFMPLSLNAIHGIPIVIATATITAFMTGSALGTLVGGVHADRTGRFQSTIAIGLSLSALAVLLVAYVALPVALLFAAVAFAGAAIGFASPSRDMLVRSAAPKGASGRVFGFVYSGLDLGATAAPMIAAAILASGHPHGVFWLIAGVTVLTVLTAFAVPVRHDAGAPRNATA